MQKTTQKHVLELDGLRGLAVAMVVIGHGTGFGLIAVSGVSLFFVLSGFLITRILVHSANRQYYFSNFYARRALRIWPLYYLIVAIAFSTNLFRFSHTDAPLYRYLFYIQNFWSMNSAPPILGPTWSLAIEEQFYLAWPLLVWLGRGKTYWVKSLSAVLIVSTPLVRVLYHLHHRDPYALTFGRLDGLAAGALLAAISIDSSKRSKSKGKWLAACAALALLILPFMHSELLRKAFKDTSTNLLFLSVVGFAFFWSGHRSTKFLRSGVLRFLGKISYATYLVHLSLIYRFSFPIAATLTIVLATLSWYCFEQPILRLKDRFTRTDSVT